MGSSFRFIFLVLSHLVVFSFSHAKDLPSFITPCKRNQSGFEICIIELIHKLKTRLPDGILEMKIQPLDPFYLPVVEFGSDSGLISVNNAIFENITVYGCSDFSFKNISFDFQIPKITVDIVFPFARIDCNYNISASTFFFPVSGDGLFNGNFTNVSVHGVIYGEYYTENKQQYVKVINQEISLDIESSEAHLEDTGNSLKNAVMNDFWPTVFTVIKPKAEIKVGQIALSIFKNMLELYSVQDLAPH